MGAYKREDDGQIKEKKEKTKEGKNLGDDEWTDSWPLIPAMDGVAGRKVIFETY